MVVAACGSDDDGDSATTTEDAATQDPTTQEPTTQEPTTQEPTTQEPTTQEPTTQEPTTQEPSADPEDTTAAGADLEELIAAAEEEGSVMYYGVVGPAFIEALGAAFEAAYPGIDFEYVRGLPTDLSALVDTEISTGQGIADVVSTVDQAWIETFAGAGNLLDISDLPNVQADFFQDEWLKGDGSFLLDIPVVQRWQYNTDALPDGVDGCEDFLDPALRGLIGISEPSGVDSMDSYLWLKERCGDDFLERLAEMEPRIYPGCLPIAEALASGEIVLSPHGGVTCQQALVDQGAPLATFNLEPPRVAAVWAGVPTSAPHPNAARLLANFLLTPEANVAKGVFPVNLSTNPDTPNGVFAEGYELRDSSQISPEELAEFQAEFDELFR